MTSDVAVILKLNHDHIDKINCQTVFRLVLSLHFARGVQLTFSINSVVVKTRESVTSTTNYEFDLIVLAFSKDGDGEHNNERAYSPYKPVSHSRLDQRVR